MLRSQRPHAAASPDATAPEDRMPIEELARRTGTTVSNLRALQAKKLLPPPELQGRKGFYTGRHQARVALLRRLQDRGYSLSAIADLLRGWERGAGLREILELEDAVTAPLAPAGEEPARDVDAAHVLPELLHDQKQLARAIDLGLVVRRGDRLVAPSPELLEIARVHLQAGLPLDVVLAEYAQLRRDVARITRRLREVFDQHVFAPFSRAGAPAKELPRLTEALARLRPAAARAIAIVAAREIELGAPDPTPVKTRPKAEPKTQPATKPKPRSRAAAPRGAARDAATTRRRTR